jgi:hypothetical protein
LAPKSPHSATIVHVFEPSPLSSQSGSVLMKSLVEKIHRIFYLVKLLSMASCSTFAIEASLSSSAASSTSSGVKGAVSVEGRTFTNPTWNGCNKQKYVYVPASGNSAVHSSRNPVIRSPELTTPSRLCHYLTTLCDHTSSGLVNNISSIGQNLRVF